MNMKMMKVFFPQYNNIQNDDRETKYFNVVILVPPNSL